MANKEKIDFKYNLKLYLKFVKKYRYVVLSILLMIFVVESLNLLEKFMFKIIIDRGTDFSANKLSAEIFVKIMLILAIIYITSAILKAVSKFFKLHWINKLEAGLITDIKRNLFDHIIYMDYSYHTKHKTGSMISKLARIGNAVERMTDVFVFNSAPTLFQLVVVSASLLYFSWVPALILFLTVLMFVVYSFMMQRIQESSNVGFNNAEDFEKATIADILTNIESIKYFGKEGFIKRKFREVTENTNRKLLKFWGYHRWTDAIQVIILAAGTFALVYSTIKGFLAGVYSLGTLVFVYTTFASLVIYLFSLVSGIRGFYKSMADFDALFRYTKLKNKVIDKNKAKDLNVREGEIIFNNVTFKYGQKCVFRNFNLVVPKGKRVALVGHSGCGKTTLVKLLYRLYDVDSGAVLIDGKNIKEFKQESLRSEMSIVPQECLLFDDTIYHNIAFSNTELSKFEVIRAARFAQLDCFVKELPNKWDTVVGERGVKLSGGEKQRVSIARAILANKKILVLDEATSSLDSHTENEIKTDLDKLMKGRTCIIIAHRLSTIMNADKIVVMKRGKIAQEGTHNELIRQEGEYKHLWGLQKGGYIR